VTEEVKNAEDGVEPGDIVFECPQCGKSLAIESRGAGMIVICPDCQTKVQVPGEEAAADEQAPAHDAYGETVEALQAQNESLKRALSRTRQRLHQISDELVLIQASLDRMVDLLQEDAG
jgi:uncharacterized Zn finger protein (UPF0148 family)